MTHVIDNFPSLINKHKKSILADWMALQLAAYTMRMDLISEKELQQESSEFLELLNRAIQNDNFTQIEAEEYTPLREFLRRLSTKRALKGFSPTETATFVMSLKEPLYKIFKEEKENDPDYIEEIWEMTSLLDQLALYTASSYHESREGVIARQQQELLELSTPVAKLWEGIIMLPLIGTLDSERTQQVMESLLQKIVETGSSVAIIDITGIPMVDTMVAQHLIKTVSAARLMGAECIVSGIRPQIAQTMVHLGVTLQEITTKASLADALAIALKISGFSITRNANS